MSSARTVTSISPDDAGLLLEHVHVLERLEVLRARAAHVGDHLALGVEREPDQATASRDRQHRGAGAPSATPERRARRGRRATRAAGHARSSAPAASARAQRAAAPAAAARRRRAPKRTSAAKPAQTAQASASAMPSTSSAPKPRTIGTGRQQQHEEADRRGHARGQDRRPAGRRGGRGRRRAASPPRARCSSKRAWNWIA